MKNLLSTVKINLGSWKGNSNSSGQLRRAASDMSELMGEVSIRNKLSIIDDQGQLNLKPHQ
jgi:hypothetical protein